MMDLPIYKLMSNEPPYYCLRSPEQWTYPVMIQCFANNVRWKKQGWEEDR